MSAFGGKADIEAKLLTRDRPPRAGFEPDSLRPMAPSSPAARRATEGETGYCRLVV